jgi:hypothetical protein
MPSTDPGANITFTASLGVSGKQWFCNRERIYEVTQRPPGALHYKTFSTYYIGGVGFSVLRGDARWPQNGDTWHPLQFAYYDDKTYSSFLTNAGQSQTLRLQPQDRRWADLILPNTNHTSTPATRQDWGGVVGELPIFLALLAFSTSREYLPNVLPRTFIKGVWSPTHDWQMDRKLNLSRRSEVCAKNM